VNRFTSGYFEQILFWLISYNGFVFTILTYMIRLNLKHLRPFCSRNDYLLNMKSRCFHNDHFDPWCLCLLGTLIWLICSITWNYYRERKLQTKCKLFCHNIYIWIIRHFEFRPFCAYLQFVHWNMYLFSCRSVDLIFCLYFRSNSLRRFPMTLIGGFSWLWCLRILRTPDACGHEEGSGSGTWFLNHACMCGFGSWCFVR